MRVLSAHAGADTGGVGWGIAQAFAGHPSITVRSSVRQTNYIGYPNDLDWSHAAAEARRADVLHLHNTLRTAEILAQPDKPFVLHHHGTHYRDNADVLNLEVARRMGVAVVSTLDLLDYGPDLTWVPAAFDVPWLRSLRRPLEGRRIRVGHAPTDRAIKSTEAFLAACAKLGDHVEPVLIERRSWRECLSLKATCDAYFDQVILGYGCNAVEAWAMGLPVICGAADSTLDRMRGTFGALPFIEATEASLVDALELLVDPDQRLTYGAAGYVHALRWHDGRETVARLAPIYAAQADLAA